MAGHHHGLSLLWPGLEKQRWPSSLGRTFLQCDPDPGVDVPVQSIETLTTGVSCGCIRVPHHQSHILRLSSAEQQVLLPIPKPPHPQPADEQLNYSLRDLFLQPW